MNTPRLILHNGKSMEEMTKLIRTEAKNNECFANVCYVFSDRERARVEVTMHTLAVTMKREGFDYNRAQLQGVLKFLAEVGIGKLELDKQGRPDALREIVVTLQSVGKTALADDKAIPPVKPFEGRHGNPMAAKTVVHSQSPPPMARQVVPETTVHNQVTLQFNGNLLKVKLNDDADLGVILSTLLKFGVLN